MFSVCILTEIAFCPGHFQQHQERDPQTGGAEKAGKTAEKEGRVEEEEEKSGHGQQQR